MHLLDVTPYGVHRRHDIPLHKLARFAQSVNLPRHGGSEDLDFVMLLRRFRSMHALDANKAASLWPLVLAAASKCSTDTSLSMPLNRRGEPTHWLTDRGTISPPDSPNVSVRNNLKRSLVYSLLRERADIACAGLQALGQPRQKAMKRAAEEPQPGEKSSKRASC